MATKSTSISTATAGQITSTPARTLRRLGIRVYKLRGVSGRRGRRR